MNLRKIILTVSLVGIGALMGLIISAEGPFQQTAMAPAHLAAQTATSTTPPVPTTPELRSSLTTARQLSQAFAWSSQQAIQAVVMIRSEQDVEVSRMPHSLFDMFPQFRMPEQENEEPQRRTRRGLGSGVIVRPDGYILTNNHVIEGADRLEVFLAGDDEAISAEIVGADPYTDIAVIRINRQNLPALTLGNSDSLMVGEWVIAVGSPFRETLQHSVTAGIVSALGRSINLVGPSRGYTGFENFIQTDAAINPGNSGGALINISGQLIGINTAISSNTGSNAGIGFAIPINMASEIMNRLVQSGEVRRGYLGVQVQAITHAIQENLNLPDRSGVLIGHVENDGPSAEAGIQEGDVVIAVNGESTQGLDNFRYRVSLHEPGQTVRLTVVRNGEQQIISVTLGELPEEFQLSRARQRTSERREEQQNSVVEIPRVGMTLEQSEPKRRSESDQPTWTISELDPRGVARASGLRVGDVIEEVNQQPLQNGRELARVVEEAAPGSSILLFVSRGESTLFIGMRIPEE